MGRKQRKLIENPTAYRDAILEALHNLTEDSPKAAWTKTYKMYRALKEQIINTPQTRAGQGDDFMRVIWDSPQWKRCRAIRQKQWKARPEYQESNRVYNRQYYKDTLKDRRQDPKVKEKLNAQRRARYAAKRAKPAELPPQEGFDLGAI